jgi:hypothetical protein
MPTAVIDGITTRYEVSAPRLLEFLDKAGAAIT